MKTKHLFKNFIRSIRLIGILGSLSEGIKIIINPIIKRVFFKHVDQEDVFKVINSIGKEEIEKFKVSFIIPVYNGMDKGLPDLIKSIRNQTFKNIEIIAVDSGSTDGTINFLLNNNVKIIKIKKEEFRHDFARNIGAENATGDFLVFTVQDAEFEDEKWTEIALKSLLAFKADSFSSPQFPKAKHDLYAEYLARNFIKNNNYEFGITIVNRFGVLSSPLFFLLNYKNREKALHIDDTNHMVRKSTFLKIRYSLHTCEDMEFAKKLIKSGGKWIYSTSTYVLHSHFYDYSQYFSRILIDSIEIWKLLFNFQKKKEKPYIYDTAIFLFLLFLHFIDYIEQEILKMHTSSKENIANFLVIYEDRLPSDLFINNNINNNNNNFLNSFDFLSTLANLIRKYTDQYSNFLIVLLKWRNALFRDGLFNQLIKDLGLKFPKHILYDRLVFNDIREHVLGHLFSFLYDIQNITFNSPLKYEDFKRLILLALINAFGVNLAKLVSIYEDNNSVNNEMLQKVKWR